MEKGLTTHASAPARLARNPSTSRSRRMTRRGRSSFHRRLDRPDNGHATHVPDLEIDDDHVRVGLGDLAPD